jgi:hypothetical protein
MPFLHELRKTVARIRINHRVTMTYWTHQAKLRAHTGRPQPNISTIFMGKSSADELE